MFTKKTSEKIIYLCSNSFQGYAQSSAFILIKALEFNKREFHSMSKSVYDFQVKDINGTDHSLSEYRGKLLLIVNVASQCGFTPQYEGLEKLFQEYKDQLVVLGFPCNQFGKQEPGNEEEIKNFCKLNYDVNFPLFSKLEVNGPNTHPLYDFLKEEQKGLLGTKNIKWNFTKFLVNKNGEVVKRYAPTDSPEKIKEDIKKFF